MAAVIWIGLCIMIGSWSLSWRKSFWYGFLFALFLSPLIAGIILLIQGKK